MSSVNMSIRIQEEIREQAKQVLSEYGLDMTTAINMFFRKVIATHGIPFDLRPDTPNAETIAALQEAKEILRNPAKHKKYNDFAAYMKDKASEI
ncbi:addiction module antitoxin RelB [Campylobacterota bacterium]|nr:addiction module antitoxin RelB [Campylobacterota bacterium]